MKFWRWMSAWTRYSEKYLVFLRTNLFEHLLLVCQGLMFLRTMLSYKFVNHTLCNSNNVLLSVARFLRLFKDFKILKSYIAAICEVEFCSVGLLKSSFVVVSKSRYCKFTYSAVRSNFISITVLFFFFLFYYLLFVFSVIYLANKSTYYGLQSDKAWFYELTSGRFRIVLIR